MINGQTVSNWPQLSKVMNDIKIVYSIIVQNITKRIEESEANVYSTRRLPWLRYAMKSGGMKVSKNVII